MSNFKNAIFDEGWEIKSSVTLWGNDYDITVSANAYEEEDGISPEQEDSCRMFLENKAENQKTIELLLEQYFPNLESSQICERLTPETFIIWESGDCALLLSDAEEPDDGLAVIISPTKEVVQQDEYLSENY